MIVTDEATHVQQSCQLRRATLDDRAALLEMYRNFEPKGAAMGLPPRKDPGKWLEMLAPYANFVVFVKGRLVGHAVLCNAGDTGEVAVFIHQDCRGRGLGKKLLGATIEEARRLGLRRVWGIAEADNIPMLCLAYSLGFVPGKERGEFHLDLQARQESYTPAA